MISSERLRKRTTNLQLLKTYTNNNCITKLIQLTYNEDWKLNMLVDFIEHNSNTVLVTTNDQFAIFEMDCGHLIDMRFNQDNPNTEKHFCKECR